MYYLDKVPPSLELKTNAFDCWVCLVFRLFEQSGRSCQRDAENPQKRKSAEEIIKQWKLMLLAPEEPFYQQLFEGELRRGKFTLWNALHIAAVTLLPFNLLFPIRAGCQHALFNFNLCFRCRYIPRFFSLCTTKNLFSFDCCYGKIQFSILTVIIAYEIFGIVPSLSH